LCDAVLLLLHVKQGKKCQRKDNNATVCVYMCICERVRACMRALLSEASDGSNKQVSIMAGKSLKPCCS